MWSRAAHAVIHHTALGREQALARYAYREDAIHRVIPHGHWGARFAPHAQVDRAGVEASLGLTPGRIRLGVIGAPRVEKDVQLVLDAFHACSRDDLELLVVCLKDERVPDDPRIRALPSAHVPEHVYYQRLAAIDALVFPFTSGMLMTGTAFDAIGAEKAAIISDWPVLDEVLGAAAIPYGATREDLTACLESLAPEQLQASSAAMKALQAKTDWHDIAKQTHDLLEEVAIS
jgi:glycosyltransferase involved in cell wall biosynthesis